MLFYIRESDKDKIICNVDEKDIAEHLLERLKKEQEEKEKKWKEKAEAHLYTIIKVACDKDFADQIGKDIFFDLVDHDKARSFRVQKQQPFICFKEEVAKEFGIPVQFQRFWLWAKRQNHTYRPNRPLTQLEESHSVGQLREVSSKAQTAELKLFLEIEHGPLEDGDIICFQRALTPDDDERFRYPHVRSFLECMHNRQIVHFRRLDKPKEDGFCLELLKLNTYDNVVEKVAEQPGLDDPSKIRLTSHNCYSQQPKPQPIKHRGVDHLSDMLVHYNQTSDILYNEVLDIPLSELQGLKSLKVTFHHAMKDEVSVHVIRLPKHSTVADVRRELKTKVELSNPNAELWLIEIFYHKIYKVFTQHEKIENINDQYWTLRAEEIPEEEENLTLSDRLILVYHFSRDASQNHMIQNFGEPFFLAIHEDETLAEVKERIKKKLQVPDEEFAKWKFAFISLGRPKYLQDTDIVFNRFQRRDIYGPWEQYLGLEHSDKASKRNYQSSQPSYI